MVLGTALVTGCDTDISSNIDDDLDVGTADFTTFVAVGDSLTAGYADDALYREGQGNSFPAILAERFAQVGGGAFLQPLMPVGATGSLNLTGATSKSPLGPPGDLDRSDRIVFVASGVADPPVKPVEITPAVTTSIDTRVGTGGFQNMGVPGAKFYHVALPGYGELSVTAIDTNETSNPYFARFSSSDAASMLGDTLPQAPTFFTLWLGNNDLLGYATEGGIGTVQTMNRDVSTYGPDEDVTDPEFFSLGGEGASAALPNYATVVALLKGASAKGVLINVPNVSSIPFFTRVGPTPLPLDQTDADDANMGFAAYNAFLQSIVAPSASPCPIRITQEEADRRTINFVAGNNAAVILDENLTDLTACSATALSMRQNTADDFILLTTASKLGADAGPPDGPYLPGSIWGVSGPLLDGDVLIDTEIAALDAAQASINATIKATADADPDLLYLDAAALLVQLNEEGIFYGTGGVTGDFFSGGAFSGDGVHLTARGYALVANEIIKLIEDNFGANLQRVDPGEYTTVFNQ